MSSSWYELRQCPSSVVQRSLPTLVHRLSGGLHVLDPKINEHLEARKVLDQCLYYMQGDT